MGKLALAGGAVAEDLEPVAGDLETGAVAQLVEEWFDGAIFEWHDNSTSGADQMVMVTSTSVAANVRMAAVRSVDAVEQPVLHEHIERTKHGCSANSRIAHLQIAKQLIGAEGSLSSLDRIDDRTTRSCDSVPRLL